MPNCCRLIFYIAALLTVYIALHGAHSFYNDLRTHLRREDIVDKFPSMFGEMDLYSSINYYQDPCILYHRNRHLYNLALQHNWTHSIELAYQIVLTKYPESSQVGENRWRLCGFECSPHILIDCSSKVQWLHISDSGRWDPYTPHNKD